VPPERRRYYVIGADVAEGVRGGDFSCAQVVDYDFVEQSAIWHGRVSPDIFGHILYTLGAYYNWAFIAVEANSIGSTVLHVLHDLGYPNLYYRERLDPLTRKVVSDKLGWLTTTKTKGPMLHELGKRIREGSVVLHDKLTIDELMSFTYDTSKSGKEQYGAEPGCHDDTPIALAIALAARESPQCEPPEDFDPMDISFMEAVEELGIHAPRRRRGSETELEEWCLS